jgi:hypothetical protein
METISSVKFATLHNEKTIFYSHIRHLGEVFNKINSIDHEVILITGADDVSVVNFSAPDNVKYWFAQNCLVQHEKIIPIPIGLRNSFPYHIENQSPILCGCDYYWGQISEKMLTQIYLNDNSIPNDFLYANFNLGSNLGYRPFLKNICEQVPFINYEDPVEDDNGYGNYYSKILDHQFNFCPIGNGIDTHRIWETLYCKRIPITLNCNCSKYPKINKDIVGESWQIPPQEDEYAIYTKLYSKLPIIVLDSYEELFDKNHLQELMEEQKNKKYNYELLDFNYWKNLILDLETTLNLE